MPEVYVLANIGLSKKGDFFLPGGLFTSADKAVEEVASYLKIPKHELLAYEHYEEGRKPFCIIPLDEERSFVLLPFEVPVLANIMDVLYSVQGEVINLELGVFAHTDEALAKIAELEDTVVGNLTVKEASFGLFPWLVFRRIEGKDGRRYHTCPMYPDIFNVPPEILDDPHYGMNSLRSTDQ